MTYSRDTRLLNEQCAATHAFFRSFFLFYDWFSWLYSQTHIIQDSALQFFLLANTRIIAIFVFTSSNIKIRYIKYIF